jgi:hypothetical protein
LTCSWYHWIDNILRSSQKFESFNLGLYLFFYEFWEFTDLEQRVLKFPGKKVTGQIQTDLGQIQTKSIEIPWKKRAIALRSVLQDRRRRRTDMQLDRRERRSSMGAHRGAVCGGGETGAGCSGMGWPHYTSRSRATETLSWTE